MLAALLILLLAVIPAYSRTIVVALDGSGDYTHIREGVEATNVGDSVLVRDGNYYDESFTVDSAVVVFAENHGGARIWGTPSTVAWLHGSAELIGFRVFGNSLGIAQTLVLITGGPARVINCEFLPAARFGTQLVIAADWHLPIVRHCRFCLSGANWIMENGDSTDIWMPDNYYGTMDTSDIHWFIQDGHDPNTPWLGFVTVSPVADTFEWLAVDEQPRPMPVSQTIELYPNPSNGTISIDLNGMVNIQQIDVFNILGQRVYTLSGTRNPQRNIFTFDLPLPSGSYFISVHEPKKYHTAKFTIIR